MDGIELTQLERWAKQPRLVGALGARVLAAKGIDILPEAQVEELEFNAQKTQIQSLLLRHGGRNIKVNMRRVVLSGGALGVTQLLLKARLKHPELLGGPDGPLGRYYMGHIMGSIACIVLNRPADFATLDFSADPDGSYVRRRFTPSAQAQRDRALLNTSFYIDNPPFYDHRHRNPTLSLVFLGLAIPPIGRQLVAEAMRLKHIGPAPHRYVAHVLNVLRKPWVAAINVFDILSRRYLSDVRKPGFILENSKGIYALNYHAEQLPNPDSRVTLKNATGDLQVDFRYLPQDAESVLKAHELLDQSMRASGLGHLEFARPAAERLAHIQEQASDGFHQIGTTRMGEGPQQGVVNQDLQVHGIGNLFIASSSVFTTSGEANPTLLAVAMGLRLAAHLSNAAGGTAPDNQL
jgi:choline dehydrogenase-like flavoprotein